jgi:CheY-like chemotaxis protein
MPHLSGFQLLGALRLDPRTRTIPVAFITASAQRSDIERFVALGVLDHLIKPFGATDLRSLVQRALARLEVAHVD